MLRRWLHADSRAESAIRLLALLLLAAALLNALRAMTTAWEATLLGPHDFRQTQTAITAYYLMKGGPWLAYETPVLGAPWAIPFEFPLYQLLAAGLAATGMMPLDQAGRAVSILMFLACMAPAWLILARLKFASWQRMILLAVWLCSPTYLFWSRAFLIESTALFLALVYLAAALHQLETPAAASAMAGALAGALAGAVKITTWYAFVAAALIAWAWQRFGRSQGASARPLLRTEVCFFVAFVVVPAGLSLAWTRFADSVKALNPTAGAHLRSAALVPWNFGSLEQRGMIPMWDLFHRSLTDAFLGPLPALMILLAGILLGRQALAALAGLGLYCIGALTFTSLHRAHDYYQYAISVFLIFAVGVVLVRGLERSAWVRALAVLGLLAVLVGQLRFDWRTLENMGDVRLLEAALAARDATRPDEVLVIFGADWSSVIPYYSERRALMDRFIGPLPGEHPAGVRAVAALAPARVGAGLFCYSTNARRGRMLKTIRFLDLDPKPSFSNGLCEMHLRRASVPAGG